jgi:hypothetical protein
MCVFLMAQLCERHLQVWRTGWRMARHLLYASPWTGTGILYMRHWVPHIFPIRLFNYLHSFIHCCGSTGCWGDLPRRMRLDLRQEACTRRMRHWRCSADRERCWTGEDSMVLVVLNGLLWSGAGSLHMPPLPRSHQLILWILSFGEPQNIFLLLNKIIICKTTTASSTQTINQGITPECAALKSCCLLRVKNAWTS